jgi:hypothetical protein
MSHNSPMVDGHSVAEVRVAAENIVYAYSLLPIKGKNGTQRRADQEGGMLTILNSHNGEIRMETDPIGFFFSHEKTKYALFSREKGKRLFENHPNVSSFESRNPDEKKFGGAIVAQHLIVSFSGLPEVGDEAVCLVLAVHFKWLTLAESAKITAISKNIYFELLLKKISKLGIM